MTEVQNLNNVHVLDCTIRDGGYLNDWQFSIEQAQGTYLAAVAAGVDFLELGFFKPSGTNPAHGPWTNLTRDLVDRVTKGNKLKKPALAAMVDWKADFDVSALPTPEASGIDMVRIAVPKGNIIHGIEIGEKIKELGYQVAVNCMAIGSTTFEERWKIALRLLDTTIDVFYVADSYGSLFPHEIPDLVQPFVFAQQGSRMNPKRSGPLNLGFHPHNNLQLAFANTLQILKMGFNYVDCTLLGMGRGPGNLCTEIFLAYIEKFLPLKFNVVPVLACIQEHFIPMYMQKPWGYHPTYVASAISGVHPNYVTYTVSDSDNFVLAYQIIEQIKELGVSGYKPEVLRNVMQSFKTRTIKALPAKEHDIVNPIFGSEDIPAPVLNAPAWYVNKHPQQKFLVLANGPSLSAHIDEIRAYILRENPIVIGVNNVLHQLEPNYHLFTRPERLVKYLKDVSPKSTIVVGEELVGHPLLANVKHEVIHFSNNAIKQATWDVHGVISSNCGSTSILGVALALIMGAERVTVAGLDGYLQALNPTNKDKRVLYYQQDATPPTEEEVEQLMVQHWLDDTYLWQLAQKASDAGVHINIITPTSHKRFYRGIQNF